MQIRETVIDTQHAGLRVWGEMVRRYDGSRMTEEYLEVRAWRPVDEMDDSGGEPVVVWVNEIEEGEL